MGNSNEPVVRMGDVLIMAPQSEALNGDVLARLGATWTNIPAVEIACLGVFGIARELMVTLPDNEGFSNELRLKVAEEVIALLGRFDIVAQTTQSRSASTTVHIQRNFNEMSLRQLLATIIDEPNVYAEAVRYIIPHPELRDAASKTYKWVVLKADGAGGIDLEATMSYVLELSKPHAVPQRRVAGRRPVWLGQAMGVNDLPLVHPITGRLTQGPDSNGFDWSTRPKELLEAVLWATKTGHTLLPDLRSDVYGWSEQLFQEPLPRRFQQILEDYLDAKESGVSTTEGIRADWPEDLPFDSAYTFTAMANAVAVDYEALVRQAANLVAPLTCSGMSPSVRGGVYTTIQVNGMQPYLKGPIVLNGGNISGMNPSGTVYMPPGKTLRISGMNPEVRVVNQTWKQLAERLGLV